MTEQQEPEVGSELPITEESSIIDGSFFINSEEDNDDDVIDYDIEEMLEHPSIPQSLKIAFTELKTCIDKTLRLNKDIQEAKTSVKKKYLIKKRTKNNNYAAQLVAFIDRYKVSRAEVEKQQDLPVVE